MKMTFEISGNIVDVVEKRIYKGLVKVADGKITGIEPRSEVDNVFIMPGFVCSF